MPNQQNALWVSRWLQTLQQAHLHWSQQIIRAAEHFVGSTAQGLEAQAQRLQSDIATGQAAAERASADAAAAAVAVKQLEAAIEADVRMKASISERHIGICCRERKVATLHGPSPHWAFNLLPAQPTAERDV